MTTSSSQPPAGEEPTIGRLVAETTSDLSALIRGEIELAKKELRVSVKAGGMSIGLFGAAGFLLVLGIVMLSVAFALALNAWFAEIAVAFVIVFGVYVVIAGLMGLVGVKLLRRVKAPEQTIASMKSNKQVLKRG